MKVNVYAINARQSVEQGKEPKATGQFLGPCTYSTANRTTALVEMEDGVIEEHPVVNLQVIKDDTFGSSLIEDSQTVVDKQYLEDLEEYKKAHPIVPPKKTTGVDQTPKTTGVNEAKHVAGAAKKTGNKKSV